MVSARITGGYDYRQTIRSYVICILIPIMVCNQTLLEGGKSWWGRSCSRWCVESCNDGSSSDYFGSKLWRKARH